MDSTLAYYAREADRIARGPQFYGGDAAVASLRCFRAYHADARWQTVDRAGVVRWFTPTMMRIEAILLRVGSVGSGYTNTRAIAAEARCSPGYVSKMLTRFESWGTVGVIRTRGRYGKLMVFVREKGDQLDWFAAAAKRRMYASSVGIAARALRRGTFVSSIYSLMRRVSVRVTVTTDSNPYGMEETLVEALAKRPFGRAILHERARLAIEDPDGEQDAVWPLSEEQAWQMWSLTAEEGRSRPAYDNEGLITALGIDTSRGSGRIPCPAHGNHKNRTLSWKLDGDRLLLHCFAGCTFAEIRAAVG